MTIEKLLTEVADMGTRADFYVGRGIDAEWLGSIAFDGYPDGGVGDDIDLSITSEAEYRETIKKFIDSRTDGTKPEDGWPWPWNNSCTSDYAYAFDDGKIYCACFGHRWFDPINLPEGADAIYSGGKIDFPDMADRKKFTIGKRSGVIVCGRSGTDEN